MAEPLTRVLQPRRAKQRPPSSPSALFVSGAWALGQRRVLRPCLPTLLAYVSPVWLYTSACPARSRAAPDNPAMAMSFPLRSCNIPGCMYPAVRDVAKHRSDFHALTRKMKYQGTSVEVRRDGLVGRISCPCGLPDHARYDFQKIYRLSRKDPHPHDPDACPDQTNAQGDRVGSNAVVESAPSMDPSDPDPFGFPDGGFPEPFPMEESPAGDPPPVERLAADYPPPVEQPSVDNPFLNQLPEPFEVDAMPVDLEMDLMACLPAADALSTVPVAPSNPIIANRLLQLGLIVDPRFRLTICVECRSPVDFRNAHVHLASYHELPLHARHALPTKGELEDMLLQLNAHEVLGVFPGPIPPIPGIAVVDAVRCKFPGCPTPLVFSDRRRLNEHYQVAHPGAMLRAGRSVKAHALSNFRATRQMVEVTDIPISPAGPLLEDVDRYLDSVQLYGLSETFQPIANARSKGTVYAQAGWDSLLSQVNICDLRATVQHPSQSNPADSQHHALVLAVERYYSSISLRIPSLPTLTARAILSSAELTSKLFRSPQERGTVTTYARLMALFLVFLLRHASGPMPSFPVPLHPSHLDNLSALKTALDSENPDNVSRQIHLTILSLLSQLSHEATLSDRSDLFALFLIAHHLRDSSGNVTRASAIPPNISAIQWCLRATAVLEVLNNAPQYQGDTYQAFEVHAKHLIREGKPSLFTYLRQKHAFFSKLAYDEPGLPRFSWDLTMRVLSVEGFPLSIDLFPKSIVAVQGEMQALVTKLTHNIDFSDVFAYIDSRTDPANPTMWFVDHPREDLQGTSFVSQDATGLATYSQRLLKGLVNGGVYFTKVDGNLLPKSSAIWRWITDLDEFVSAMYFGVAMTWGGGARGTECDHIRHTIHGVGERHVYILNGLLGVATTYVKTQHNQGHGRLIVRTPSHPISRLLIFAISVLYPVAAKLASFVMEVDKARNYLSYLFVHHGTVLASRDFGNILEHHTERHFGHALGLRDYRQVMCTMLCSLAKADYAAPDADDHDLAAIHAQFGHSASVADAHYGIQTSNALATISHTAVRSMQRVSARWHACMGLSHSQFGENLDGPGDRHVAVQLVDSLKAPLASSLQEVARACIQDFYSTAVPHWTNVMQGFGSDLTSFINDTFRAPHHPFPSQLPPLVIHPQLSSHLRVLFPGPSGFSFKSIQQAELVQSCLTNEHVLAVLPTGSGKSLAFFGAPILAPTSLFIVVTPFVALTEDMERRLSALPIAGGRWTSDLNPFEAQLVIVPAHEAGTEGFFRWAEANSPRLQRLFVDEAHHIFTSDSYRLCFKLLHKLTQLKKPITFLTATISTHSIPALCHSMMIDPTLLRLIRAPVSRPNIKYQALEVSPDQIVQKTVEVFKNITLLPNERGIIYTSSIAFTHQLADLLGIHAYTSRVLPDELENKEEKSRRFQAWRSGTVQWVAATVCFAEGVDFPSVRYTILVEPMEMLSFLQESGRLGRDGIQSNAIAIWSRIPTPPPLQDPDHCGKRSLAHFLQTPSCRRLAFKGFDPEVHSCASSAENALCDRCEGFSASSQLSIPQPLRFDLPYVKETITAYPTGVAAMPPTPNAQQPNPDIAPKAIPYSLSVQKNGQLIDHAYVIGGKRLDALRRLVARVVAINCPDCWVLGESHRGEHSHTRSYRLDSVLSSLRSKRREEHVFWPSCHLCWIPFRAPCHHPSIKRGDKLIPEHCPNQNIPHLIPTLISLIYLHDEADEARHFLHHVSLNLNLNPPLSSHKPLSQFVEWVTEPSKSPDTIPNFSLFLIAFSEHFER